MSERELVGWLYRRVGFGCAVGELDRLEPLGSVAALDALIRPEVYGVAPARDPWADLDIASFEVEGTNKGAQTTLVIVAWLTAMATTTRPLDEWMRWFWHGHFVSSFRTVRPAQLMVQQLRMLGTAGLGDFPSLLRAVTVDPAMLVYLDGNRSRKGAVNENYGRELLELFSLGVGNYSEADVRAGAEALTGWTVPPEMMTSASPAATLVAARHDDRPQSYLGRRGVHDVDTVIESIVSHPACAPFIVGKLARAILGPIVDEGLIKRLAKDFVYSGMQIRPLVRAILEEGLDGASGALVVAPVPWLVAMAKATAVPMADLMRTVGLPGLTAADQLPLHPPNVAGWPGGMAWLSSATTVGRFNLAQAIASLTPDDALVRRRAVASNWHGMADALGCPGGFGEATRQALDGLRPRDPKGSGLLTVAMTAPELVIA